MPKNYKSFGELDSQALLALKLSEASIDPLQRQQYVNDELVKIFDLADSLLDPFYDFTTVLTVSGDQELLKGAGTANNGVITNTNAANKSLTRNDAIPFTVGSLIFASRYKGDNQEITGQFIGRITAGGVVGIYEIIAGTPFDFVGDNSNEVSLVVLKTFSLASADISGIYVRRILNITDDKTRPTQPSFDMVQDIDTFRSYSTYTKTKGGRVWFLHRGDTIQFGLGSNAVSLGNVTMLYRGFPGFYTDATRDNAVPVPPSYNQQLFDTLVARYATHVQGSVPADVAARLSDYKSRYDAAQAASAKLQAKQGK